MNEETEQVWVFHGEGAKFACAVFRTKDSAMAWIASSGVTGILTAYPLDCSVYDWALSKGFFKPKREDQRLSKFIQRFTSASQEHHHFDKDKAET